jgi:hypothetical protein
MHVWGLKVVLVCTWTVATWIWLFTHGGYDGHIFLLWTCEWSNKSWTHDLDLWLGRCAGFKPCLLTCFEGQRRDSDEMQWKTRSEGDKDVRFSYGGLCLRTFFCPLASICTFEFALLGVPLVSSSTAFADFVNRWSFLSIISMNKTYVNHINNTLLVPAYCRNHISNHRVQREDRSIKGSKNSCRFSFKT